MTDPGFDPRLLVKAAGPGRIRAAVLEAWSEAKATPRRAGSVLRGATRHNRSLHSRERRLVQDALFGLVRTEGGLAEIVGTDSPLDVWIAWLVLQGLPADAATPHATGPWADLHAAWDRLGAGCDAVRRLELRHSLPAPLAEALVGSLGVDQAEAFLIASDRRAPVTIRCNRLKCSRDALVTRLAADGIVCRPVDAVPDGLHVEGRHNLVGSAAFRDGWFEVQDAGSQQLAALVAPDGGTTIDLCAGAGGKSLALAAAGAEVWATDVRGRALDTLLSRSVRAGAAIRVQRIAPEGPLPDVIARIRGSRVLVDAPCTGTGTLRRHPEHRYLVDRDTVATKARLQAAILDRAAPLVAEAGRLIYGTCSVLVEENEQVVAAFLASHPTWRQIGGLKTAPHTHGTDGFFGAVLTRR